MIEKLKSKVPVWMEDCGARVAVQETPFAVAVITPLMSRSHAMQSASDVCFVDSTASCDADNHVITFMLTPTVAGAVPLAVVITDSTSQASYTAGFKLLQTIMPAPSFGGQGHPTLFITDDSDAERNSLHSCWPLSFLKLCLFHVPQAVWRWLWAEQHGISKEDRRDLMTEFRRIIYSRTEDEAEVAFQEAMNSETAVEYPIYQKYLEDWWSCRELWCMAWRTEHHRGHHTNNFAEVTVRLYKDVVLQRAKAYNPVALVDFTVRVMEDYYRNRLRDFANGRIPAQRLLMDKLSAKASYLVSRDQMEEYGENRFGVPNSDGTELYIVDASSGCCSCKAGLHGTLCKHQLAVMMLFNTAFPNVPGVTAQHRHSTAYLAIGYSCPSQEFYDDLVDQSSSAAAASTLMTSDTAHLQQVTQSATDVSDVDDNTADQCASQSLSERSQEFLQLMEDKLRHFGDSQQCDAALGKAIARLRAVTSGASLTSFLHNPGLYRRHRAGSTIRVQPTALSRRRPEVTRGSKRLASGRPPLGSAALSRKKRPRRLACNVAANVPNAKSHV